MKKIVPILLAFLIFMTGCVSHAEEPGYTQIDQETAKEMMSRDDDHIIVDVRRQDEFASAHISEAICIPNESIGTVQPEELPDLNQIILIYCRSGNRSKQAAEKLALMGYTNIYEFGGINTWTGEIEEGDNGIWTETELPVSLEYLRLDETLVSAKSEDPEKIGAIIKAVQELKVGDKNDRETLDQGDYLTFTLEDGRTVYLEFEGDNWITKNQERYYVDGLQALHLVFNEMLSTDD